MLAKSKCSSVSPKRIGTCQFSQGVRPDPFGPFSFFQATLDTVKDAQPAQLRICQRAPNPLCCAGEFQSNGCKQPARCQTRDA